MQLNGAAQQAAQQQPQTVSVPVETPVSWSLNIAEAQWVLNQINNAQNLAGMPVMQVAVLVQRLQAMTTQAVQNFINPPQQFTDAEHVKAIEGSLVESSFDKAVAELGRQDAWYEVETYEEMQDALKDAEACRREPLGSLDVSPAANPQEDYAAAGMAITAGLQHLDEALPGGQRGRALHAYAALRWGVWKLGEYLNIHLPIEKTRGRAS